MTNKYRSDDRVRILLSQECAKIILEEGVKDFKIAKHKAAQRLDIGQGARFPSNLEIEQAIIDYQRLFNTAAQESQLHHLRKAALNAMSFLQCFQPHLVGSVLRGIVTPHEEVQLHIFADTVEEVMIFLLENGISYNTSERRFRIGDNTLGYYPVIVFNFDKTQFDLTIFDFRNLHSAPKSPVDGKPMRRADIAELKRLLENS